MANLFWSITGSSQFERRVMVLLGVVRFPIPGRRSVPLIDPRTNVRA
jgi:hypothetical protein